MPHSSFNLCVCTRVWYVRALVKPVAHARARVDRKRAVTLARIVHESLAGRAREQRRSTAPALRPNRSRATPDSVAKGHEAACGPAPLCACTTSNCVIETSVAL